MICPACTRHYPKKKIKEGKCPVCRQGQPSPKQSRRRVNRGVGIRCRTCGQPSTMYAHPEGWKPKPGKQHFERWYECKNPDCRTTTFFGDDPIPATPKPPKPKKRRRLWKGPIVLTKPIDHAKWLKLHSEYLNSTRWKTFRSLVIIDRGGQCERCHSSSNLRVHHKTYERWQREELGDVELLCKDCHQLEHPDKRVI